MARKGRILWLLFLCVGIFTACKGKEETEEKKSPVSFTVCKETEIPDKVTALVEKKKKSSFRFSYEDSSHLYLVIGYGEQPQGEYVAAVKEIYETDQGIYVSSTLVSLSHGKEWSIGEPSVFPYVVIRCAKTEKNIFFL